MENNKYPSIVWTEFIQHECHDGAIGPIKKPIIVYQYIKFFLKTLITKNPNDKHYEIVQAAVEKHNAYLLSNKPLIDMTVRELIKHIEKIYLKLIALTPQEFNNKFAATKKEIADHKREHGITNIIQYNDQEEPLFSREQYLFLYEGDSENLDGLFENNELFIWDKALLDILKYIGPCGEQKASNDGIAGCKKTLVVYKETQAYDIEFWIGRLPTEEKLLDPKLMLTAKPLNPSSALTIVAEAIIEDITKKLLNLSKSPPAITNPIHKNLSKIQSQTSSEIISINEQEAQFFNQGQLIGRVPIVDKKVFDCVMRGLKEISSATGHRVFRFLISEAFLKVLSGEKLYNILEFDGGATEIAAKIGLSGGKMIAKINQIFYALAYTKWDLPDLHGNLIIFQHYRRGTIQGVRIILSPPLLPFYTHATGNPLLRPIFSEPALINPQQTHAGQFYLQDLIAAEFSDQSKELVKNGVVYIPETKWQDFGSMSKLKPNILNKVLDKWTHDGDDAPKFLEEIEKNHFSLGPTHNKELEFYIDQGNKRINQSQRAKHRKTKT